MRGYDLLTEIRKLTPEQLDNFHQYFTGQLAMDFEGFTDSTSRPEHQYAKYVFDAIDKSLNYSRVALHKVHTDDIADDLKRIKEYEADHPPIVPKGHDDLTPEKLQQLHRTQLVMTADSIEPPHHHHFNSGTKQYDDCTNPACPDASFKPHYADKGSDKCHDCGKKVYKLGTPESDLGFALGYTNSDDNVRCRKCSELFVDTKAAEAAFNPPVEGIGPYFDPSLQQTNIYPDGKPTESQIEQIMIDGLKVSTDTLAYHLIPEIAIKRLCERITLGEKTKGKDAWNALSDNQSVLDSRRALARRFGHTINHAYRLLGKIQRGEPWTEEDEREASAVMWGGMYAICAIHQQREKDVRSDNSATG